MESGSQSTRRRLTATRREAERVLPLELFFDLVFVLALTQCTALMVEKQDWEGIGQALLLLLALWWTWTAYAWLTSVIDPEDGPVRLAMAAAMAAMLVAALAVPNAFGDGAVEFALAYGAVRAAHIGLFLVASRDEPDLRRSITGFGGATVVGVVLFVVGAVVGGSAQPVIWVVAVFIDPVWTAFFGSAGWRLVPGHFAERHGLIIIVALGESVVALGVGSTAGLTTGVTIAAILGIALVFELWWIYFDVVAIANVRRLVRAAVGRQQNELARDVYSYLHFPLVAGIELAAFGLHDILLHPGEHLDDVAAVGLLGGLVIYLLGHVAIRLRGAGTLNVQRCIVAAILLALLAVAGEVSAVVLLGIATVLLATLITYETRVYGPGRIRVRHDFAIRGPMAEWPIDRTGDRTEG